MPVITNDALRHIILPAKPIVVVTAPPGAGKSTLLPLSLLEQVQGKILMLEPRRIAARAIAERMASLLGEKVGETVGYRVRQDSCVSAHTRLEVLTEGILTRMLIDDPTLDGVDYILFDEFHERHIQSEQALALTREVQSLLRDDLRIVIMSATMDVSSICSALNAPLVDIPGERFPVTTIREEEATVDTCAQVVAHVVRRALRENTGDILAFLPGQADILRCQSLLDNVSAVVVPLYGMLNSEEQRRAIMPIPGQRKVVLATSIAETSLTIEGVTVVVDSGLHRRPVYDFRTGLTRLETTRISMDMALQREGRAGRLTAGTCYRLFSLATEHKMQQNRVPEILDSDLSGMLLDIKAFGADGLGETLPWLVVPPTASVQQAAQLLRALGALDGQDKLTNMGRKMNRQACHPRVAKMLVEAQSHELQQLARTIANAIEENRRELPATYDAGMLIASAYPERIGRQLTTGHYRLSNGENVLLDSQSPLLGREWLAIATLNGSHVALAAPLDPATLSVVERENVRWSSQEGRVVAQVEKRIGVHVFASRPLSQLSQDKVVALVADAAQKEGRSIFDISDEVDMYLRRVATVATWHPEYDLPELTVDVLMRRVREWLPVFIGRATTASEMKRIDMVAACRSLLSYEQQQWVDRLAPTHIVMPTARRARIDYREGQEKPVLSVRLQECFGMMDTPCVDDGRRPVLMELLSPGYKPVQLTSDLRSFWSGTYFEVRKELKRRYPKHAWPDDPTKVG